MKSVIFIIMTAFYIPSLALAFPPLVGPEFTFTNPTIIANSGAFDVSSPKAVEYQEKMINELVVRKAEFGIASIDSYIDRYGSKAYRVTYPDGWWFQVTTDPSVVEIQAKPETPETFVKMKSRMQRHIFDVAAKVGIKPHLTAGGGHINIGVATGFDEDPRHFRNFVVDLLNHPELFQHIFGVYHSKNAPVAGELSVVQQSNLAAIISDFDNGRIISIKNFVRRISDEVYFATVADWSPPCKYQALCMQTINNGAGETEILELRNHVPQKSADEFILQSNLYTKRMAYLRNQEGLVKLNPITSGSNAQDAVDKFYVYVSEAGGDWNVFKTLMPTKLKKLRPQKKLASNFATQFIPYEKPIPNYWDRVKTVCTRYLELAGF